MTRNVASLLLESNLTDSSRRKHETHAQDFCSEANSGWPSQVDLPQDSVSEAAGLNGLPHENWCCLDCGYTTSKLNEGQDIFSSNSAPPTCSFCSERGPLRPSGQQIQLDSTGDAMDISGSQSSGSLRHHRDLDVLYESLSSEQIRSLVDSFGSIEIVPHSGDFSIPMTDGGGKDLPPPSRPSPSPRPSLPPPKYPDYSSLQSRLDTFVGWPQRVVGVSPASLAASGFFYIGSADRVRCFQCGVTLRNWEPEDDPATEHVTWSPACPVALLPPGADSGTGFRDAQAPPDSVGTINGQGCQSRNLEQLSGNVDGSDHHIPPQTLHGSHVTTSHVNRTSDNRSNGATATTQNNASVVSPPALSTSNGHTGVVQGSVAPTHVGESAASTGAGLEPPSVLAVLELGCSRDAVDRVRERRRRMQGTDFPDAISLYLAVMEEESDQDSTESTQTAAAEGNASASSTPADDVTAASSACVNGTMPSASRTGNASNHSLQSSPGPSGGANGRLLGFRQCKVCRQGEVTVTFLPCGHLIACSDCAQKCRDCPRCGRTILGTVRTYFA